MNWGFCQFNSASGAGKLEDRRIEGGRWKWKSVGANERDETPLFPGCCEDRVDEGNPILPSEVGKEYRTHTRHESQGTETVAVISAYVCYRLFNEHRIRRPSISGHRCRCS